MRSGFFCLTLAVFLAFSADAAQAAAKGTQRSSVQKNMQRLLQTKSCPSCNLSGADLSRSKLDDANLEGANLTGANLALADLSGANLKKCNLQGANLGGADLAHADLDGANLTGAVLEGAFFNATRIKGRVVNRLIHTDQTQGNSTVRNPVPAGAVGSTNAGPQQTVSKEINGPVSTTAAAGKISEPKGAVGAPTSNNGTPPAQDVESLAPVREKGQEEQEIDEKIIATPAPEAKKMAAAEPPEKVADAIDASRQSLVDRMFDEKRCVGCDLSGLDLSGEDLGGFDLERANFRSSNLRKTDLSEANLKGADFHNAQLQEADLEDSDLYRADFSGADLTGASLEDAAVDGALFEGAIGVELEGAKAAK